MQKLKGLKITIPLTPVQLIWLHSHHHFMKIEQETKRGNTEIKFYKVNHGVQIRFQNSDEQPLYEVINHAKACIQSIIQENEIRLLDVSFSRNVYVKVAKQARKIFQNTYIIFLHYDTFENCCKKLNEKFGVTSTTLEFEKLRKQNCNFCFLICQKSKFTDVYNYTQQLLNSEISCASTSISNKKQIINLETENITIYKRTHSVSSLRGSFTSCQNDTHTQPQQRLSLNNSEIGEEIFQIGEAFIANLQKSHLKQILKTGMYCGSSVSVDFYEGSYLDIKKRLYYTNRLQMFPNPFMQQIYAYVINQHSASNWWVHFIVQKIDRNLKELIKKSMLHHPKSKIQLILKISKALDFLHSNMETHGNLTPYTIYFDKDTRMLLSATPSKNIPPHTNPFEYDIRLFLILVYWIFTQVNLSYQALLKKISKNELLFSLYEHARQQCIPVLQASNKLLKKQIDLKQYIGKLNHILYQIKKK